MTGTEFASALIVIFTAALMFGINLGDNRFITAPRIILVGFGLIGFTLLKRMGIFSLLGKILLGLVVVAVIVWLISDK